MPWKGAEGYHGKATRSLVSIQALSDLPLGGVRARATYELMVGPILVFGPVLASFGAIAAAGCCQKGCASTVLH